MKKLEIILPKGVSEEKAEKIKSVFKKELGLECDAKTEFVTKSLSDTVLTVFIICIIQDLYNFLKKKLGNKVYLVGEKADILIKDDSLNSVYVIPHDIDEKDLIEALEKLIDLKASKWSVYDTKEKMWKAY